ncbi:hypothetical protein E2C01_062233 [Portunus trituberculatus]|uniref:Uncharacterized protein n=1 Tax=Portunus trituberculatus TaxID=210409 RepID=A0A5B7HD32_PORTR|nr:hypothetical protein [Portunus trituberculatus]
MSTAYCSATALPACCTAHNIARYFTVPCNAHNTVPLLHCPLQYPQHCPLRCPQQFPYNAHNIVL